MYSGVLEDLRKDSSFDTAHYPTNTTDYSLQVIQLAESADRKLFVYVYQPSGAAKDFKASSINISTTINDEISYHNYKLEYLNSDGVFYKYSKGLPQFFVSDIMDDDVLCPMGENGEKLLLFDDFSCYDDGCYIGKVSKEVIAKMPKEN